MNTDEERQKEAKLPWRSCNEFSIRRNRYAALTSAAQIVTSETR